LTDYCNDKGEDPNVFSISKGATLVMCSALRLQLAIDARDGNMGTE
jgi:hypothetical protein